MSGRLTVGVAVVALPSLLWLVATPLSGGPDEPAHLIRAASLVRGQLLGEPASAGDADPELVVAVPETLAALPEPACYAGKPAVAADCAGPHRAARPRGGLVAMRTTSGRHPPPYYALVGLPYLADLPPPGNMLPRLLSALLCAAFLAAALGIAARAAGRLGVLGVLTALTPMAMQLTGVVNPNGLEAMAAICLWVALLVLARSPADTVRPPLLAAAGVSAVAMTLTRPLSSLWLGIAVATAAVVARPDVRRAVVRDRGARAWAGAALLAAVSSVAWLAVVGNPILEGARPVEGEVGLLGALRITLGRTPVLTQEMIGILGWLDTVLHPLVHRVWLTAPALLCAAALLARRWRHAAALAGLAAAVVLIPAAVGALRYGDLGLVWQGRYTLPLAAGVPILAAVTAAEATPRLRAALAALAVPLAVALAGIQCFAFAFALRRHVVGIDGPLNFLAEPGWRPPLPAAALLVGFALSQAALLLWLGWLTWHQPAADRSGELHEARDAEGGERPERERRDQLRAGRG